MIIIGNTLVSEDLLSRKFCCELSLCHGNCCVEGDAGAPLSAEEIALLDAELDNIKPFMHSDGIDVLAREGFHTRDSQGHTVTTLVRNKECVFTVFNRGIATCAIELAHHSGTCNFQKPVSCHLYPVRINDMDEYDAVNVHVWDICKTACEAGSQKGIFLYQFLKEPLIRKYGNDWYEELVITAKAWNQHHAGKP